MYGIGNYVSMGAAERQAADPSWSPSGAGRSSGGGGAVSIINALSQAVTGVIGPGGVSALARGGAGTSVPPPAATGGGGFDVGKLVPVALIGVAVVGGFFLIKKLRKKAA